MVPGLSHLLTDRGVRRRPAISIGLSSRPEEPYFARSGGNSNSSTPLSPPIWSSTAFDRDDPSVRSCAEQYTGPVMAKAVEDTSLSL
jgi:hypothetical protein